MYSNQDGVYFRLPELSPRERYRWRTEARNGRDTHPRHSRSYSTPAEGTSFSYRREPTHSYGGDIPCPLPDCVREYEQSKTQLQMTDSMMQAYVAMRGGTNSIVADLREPMLAGMKTNGNAP